MPKFTIEDVDKQIEAIRVKYRQPTPQVRANDLVAKFRDISNKRTSVLKPPVIKPPVIK